MKTIYNITLFATAAAILALIFHPIKRQPFPPLARPVILREIPFYPCAHNHDPACWKETK